MKMIAKKVSEPLDTSIKMLKKYDENAFFRQKCIF